MNYITSLSLLSYRRLTLRTVKIKQLFLEHLVWKNSWVPVDFSVEGIVIQSLDGYKSFCIHYPVCAFQPLKS